MARFLKKRGDISGAAPGSLIFLGKQKMESTKIKLFHYNSENQIEKEITSISESKKYISKNSVTWINIYGLHKTDIIQEIGEEFSIPNLVLEDILNTDHRPRFFEDDKHIIIIVKALVYNPTDKKIHADQISFVLGDNYIITFQERIAEYFESVRNRIRNKIGKICSTKSDYLLYTLLDTVIDNSLFTIELVGENIEEQDKKLIHAQRDLAQVLYNLKNEISYLRKNIRPLKEIIFQLQKSESNLITETTIPYIDDINELVSQANESIEIYYSMVADQLNLYNTFVNNKANEIMKFLTIFASIFIPLTFIVGVYGTNFDYLPELHYKNSYFIMWGVIIIVVIVMLQYFKRKKWL